MRKLSAKRTINIKTRRKKRTCLENLTQFVCGSWRQRRLTSDQDQRSFRSRQNLDARLNCNTKNNDRCSGAQPFIWFALCCDDACGIWTGSDETSRSSQAPANRLFRWFCRYLRPKQRHMHCTYPSLQKYSRYFVIWPNTDQLTTFWPRLLLLSFMPISFATTAYLYRTSMGNSTKTGPGNIIINITFLNALW